MKLGKIKQICSKHKTVYIYDKYDNGNIQQYIGDGGAVYKVIDLPYLDKTNLLAMFDVAETNREKWKVTNNSELQVAMDDCVQNERLIERYGHTIVSNNDNETYKSLLTSLGAIFINTRYLTPFIHLEGIEFFERYTSNGGIYIVAKAGMILQAAIMPSTLINKYFMEKEDEFHIACYEYVEKSQKIQESSITREIILDDTTRKVLGVD